MDSLYGELHCLPTVTIAHLAIVFRAVSLLTSEVYHILQGLITRASI